MGRFLKLNQNPLSHQFKFRNMSLAQVCLLRYRNKFFRALPRQRNFYLVIQCQLEISLVRSKQLGKMYGHQLIYFVDCSVSSTLRSIYKEVFLKPKETFKLVVPAGLYVIQNSLLFVALSNLDSATYQVRKVF